MSGPITEYLEKIIEVSKELGIRVEYLTKDQYDLYWNEDPGEFTGDPFVTSGEEIKDPEWEKAKKIAVDLAILNRRSDQDKKTLDHDLQKATEQLDNKLFGFINVSSKYSVLVLSIYATFISVILSIGALALFSVFLGATLYELGLLPSIIIPLIVTPPLAYFLFTQSYLLNKTIAENNALMRTDPLTGLYNKSFFTELVEMELVVASRYEFPSSLFLVDLDHFKRVNETYGYQVGDRVLRIVAESIVNNMRGSDLIGSFDGEKIMVYLPHTTCEQALIAAERLRRVISNAATNFEQDEITVTASIGVCASEFGFDTFDRLLQGAASAVREAKSGGRDRVEYMAKVSADHEPALDMAGL